MIGSGGREHALAWKLAQSPLCDTLYAAPGNPGIAAHATIITLDAADHGAVVCFCADHNVDLVVIGPEGPLVDGLADSLRVADVAVFGPSEAAAQLEGSKAFTKEICSYAGVPTAAYEHYTIKADALAGLSDFGLPVVIKADGLAAGKGVIIAETDAQARAAIEDMFGGGFGDDITTTANNPKSNCPRPLPIFSASYPNSFARVSARSANRAMAAPCTTTNRHGSSLP